MEGRQKKMQPILQVLICAYGKEGIERVAKAKHPKTAGVEYIVSWQTDGCQQIPTGLDRDDFILIRTATKGLSVNRNTALSKATAPLLLISDDDAEYTEEGLNAVIKSFQEHPGADIITFKYASTNKKKYYPDHQLSLSCCPKGYYISSIEIAFRKDSVKGKIWFNENFGIGAVFPSGEEDIFIKDCLEAGLHGVYMPITAVRHDGSTTSARNLMLPSRPQTKGAVILRLHPFSWPLRMLAHAMRETPLWRKGLVPSPLSFCKNWLKGVRTAKKKHVFPTQDYSIFYPYHE